MIEPPPRKLVSRILLLGVVSLFGLPASARADDVRARQLYLEGESAFTAGRFTEAARILESAYQESRRPKLLWNIAQSWRRQYDVSGDIADLQRAAAVYRHYEELAESDADRMEARQRWTEVRAEIRKVTGAAKEQATRDAAARSSAASVDKEGPLRLRNAGIVMLAIGSAALIGGAAAAVVARSAYDEINCQMGGCQYQPDTQNTLHLFDPLGDVLLVAGVAAVITGIALIVAGVRGAKNLPVTLIPTRVGSSAGATLRLEFQ